MGERVEPPPVAARGSKVGSGGGSGGYGSKGTGRDGDGNRDRYDGDGATGSVPLKEGGGSSTCRLLVRTSGGREYTTGIGSVTQGVRGIPRH